MLVLPFVVGVWLAGPDPRQLPLAAFWLAGYLAYHATGRWLRSRRRRRDLPPVLVYSGTALALGLVTLLVAPDLIRWLPLFLPLLTASIWLTWRGAERSLANDVLTVVAACLMAPVAFEAGGGGAWAELWVAVGVLTAYFLGTVLYVKTMIRERGRVGYGRCGEGVVQRVVAALLRVMLEHRKVDHPQRSPTGFDQVKITPDLEPDRAHESSNHRLQTRPEKQQIASLGGGYLKNTLDRLRVEKLGHRRLHACNAGGPVIDLHPGQTLCAVLAGQGSVLINLLAAQAGTGRHSQRGHPALRVIGRLGKHLEIDLANLVADGDQLQRNAQIGLVRPETAHRLMPAHPRKRSRQLNIQHLAKHRSDHSLGDRLDVGFIDKGHLQVQLGELRLTVGTQVFVTEAAGDLVVAIHTAHHQQLLEDLR